MRDSVTGRVRLLLLTVTLLAGVLAAVAVVLGAPPASMVAVGSSAQLLMSVLVPACGVLLARDAAQGAAASLEVRAAVVAAVIYAVAVAVAGFVVCCVVVALAPSARFGPPGVLGGLLVGGVAVQLTAQLVGTGMGFLIRRPVVGFAATIVGPLGLWLVLGVLRPLTGLRNWLTPFGSLAPLASGTPSAGDVLAWLVVLALWGGGLNAVGVRVARRGRRRG